MIHLEMVQAFDIEAKQNLDMPGSSRVSE